MNWKELEGKKVYVRLKNGRIYSGKILSIDESSRPLIFIYLLDKFKQRVVILHSEILEIREEGQ